MESLAGLGKTTPFRLICPKTMPAFICSDRSVSPIIVSTRVLLTRTVVKPILRGIEHCPTYQVGEGLSKQWDRRVCIVSQQAQALSCLTLLH